MMKNCIQPHGKGGRKAYVKRAWDQSTLHASGARTMVDTAITLSDLI